MSRGCSVMNCLSSGVSAIGYILSRWRKSAHFNALDLTIRSWTAALNCSQTPDRLPPDVDSAEIGAYNLRKRCGDCIFTSFKTGHTFVGDTLGLSILSHPSVTGKDG